MVRFLGRHRAGLKTMERRSNVKISGDLLLLLKLIATLNSHKTWSSYWAAKDQIRLLEEVFFGVNSLLGMSASSSLALRLKADAAEVWGVLLQNVLYLMPVLWTLASYSGKIQIKYDISLLKCFWTAETLQRSYSFDTADGPSLQLTSMLEWHTCHKQ